MPATVLILLPAAVLVVALALTAYGLRGRRVDDHPICRRCGFDLYGKPASSKVCSECGADLMRERAVKRGHRATRYGLVAAAMPGLALGCGGLGLAAWASARGVDLNPHKPTWWLAGEARSPHARTRDAAMGELVDRLRTGRLSSAQVADVAERVLAYQAAAEMPWGPPWDQFIEQARDDRVLSDAQWARYARQAVVLELRAASTHGGADFVNVTMRSQFRDGGNRRFLVQVWWTAPCLIDQQSGPKGSPAEPFLVAYGLGRASAVRGLGLPKHLLAQPGGPPRKVAVPVDVEVYEMDDAEARRINWWTTRPDRKLLRAEFTNRLIATWEMPSRLWIDDPKLAAAVEAAVKVTNLSLRQSTGPGVGMTWSATVRVDKPPVNVAFVVLLRAPGPGGPMEQRLGTVTCAAGRTARVELSAKNRMEKRTAPAQVLLAPSEGLVLSSFNPAQAWGGELVFDDPPDTASRAPGVP